MRRGALGPTFSIAVAFVLLVTAAKAQGDRVEAHRRQLVPFLQMLQTQGPEAALAAARTNLAKSRQLSESDPRRADALEHLALALNATAAWDESVRVSSELVARRRSEVPSEPELVALALGTRALAQFGAGKTADADRSFTEQLAVFRTAYGGTDVRLAQKLELHATRFLMPNDKHTAAVALLREALGIRRAQPGAEPAKLAEIHQALALSAIALADFETADRENLEAERQMTAAVAAAPDRDELKAGLVQMLVVHARQEILKGADNRSAELLARARGMAIADKNVESEGRMLTFVVEAESRARNGDVEGARVALGSALVLARDLARLKSAQDDLQPELMQALSELSLRQGDLRQARNELEEALRLAGGADNAEPDLLFSLAELARRQDRTSERQRLYQLALSRAKLRKSEIPILYATNRKNSGGPDKPAFGTALSPTLSFGSTIVDVPGGQFSDQSQLAAYEKASVPVGLATNATRLSMGKLEAMADEEALMRAIRPRLKTAKLYPRAVLVFVHGYNNTFEQAIRRTAQLARDLNFDGPVISFTWPSQGSFLYYGTDKEAAQGSIKALAAFLARVARGMESGTRLHLIAHSMGNRVLLPALVEAGPDLDGKLGEVILASPAIDIAQFDAALDTLSARRQGRYTLYASSHDRALYTGYFREFGTNLAGFVSNGAPTLHRGLDSIDVSEAGNIGDRLDYNHDIFATNPVVTEDIRQILQTGVRPPDKRLPNLVAKPGAAGVTFWSYKRAE